MAAGRLLRSIISRNLRLDRLQLRVIFIHLVLSLLLNAVKLLQNHLVFLQQPGKLLLLAIQLGLLIRRFRPFRLNFVFFLLNLAELLLNGFNQRYIMRGYGL